MRCADPHAGRIPAPAPRHRRGHGRDGAKGGLPLTGYLAAAFAAAMDRLGPFEPCPALAVAVSGGADSMALAVLARDWVRQHDGSAIALVVDHGLRAASAEEA